MSTEALLRRLRTELDDAGLRGSFLVRDLDRGAEIGFEVDRSLVAASLVKVPLALATLDRVHRGELDPAEPVEVSPGRVDTAGPTGTSRFRHPARIALEDLLYLSVAISDTVASDALFDRTPPDQVTATLRRVGITGVHVRHRIGELQETLAERLDPAEGHVAHAVAIGAETVGRGQRLPQLNADRASAGSARGWVDLLAELWRPTRVPEEVAGGVRRLMAASVHRQRLAPDLTADSARWSSKTGTLLNLRHEIGVVEHDDGGPFAIAALTESRVPAVVQPAAEAVMGRVARELRDHLRDTA